MDKQNLDFLKSILSQKKSLIELLAAAILIGFGVELIASSLFDFFQFENKIPLFLIFGVLLSLVGFLYYLNKIYGQRNFLKKIDAFFILDNEAKDIIMIDNYDYVNNLSQNLIYAFNEDKALFKIWNNIDFDNIYNNGADFLKIINEATEYYLLEKLSSHLSEYFDEQIVNRKELVEYERNDIPDVLLNNRLLELFSKPMHQRESFISKKEANSVHRFTRDENNKVEGKVITSYSNGAMFNHFELILPKNSKLKRKKDGSIALITERFTLFLKTHFGGINTVLPNGFEFYYLNFDYSSKRTVYHVNFEVEINFHFSSVFKRKSWQYYQWVDTFIKQLEKDISKEYYFDNKIQWDKTYPIVKILKDDKTTPYN